MFKFFGKIVALIESLISVVIPLASPTPTPVVQSPTPIPVVEITESPTPSPIEVINEPVETFSPSPTPAQDLLNNLIIQLNQLKKEIAAYTPEPTPSPQIIIKEIIYLTPTPTPTSTPISIPVSTPTTAPTPTPTPTYLPIPTTWQEFISQLPENLVKHIDWCYQNYPSITLYYAYQISNKWPSIDSPEGKKVINFGEEYGKTPNSGCGWGYLSPEIKSADIQSLYGPINLTDYQRTFQQFILDYLRTNF